MFFGAADLSALVVSNNNQVFFRVKSAWKKNDVTVRYCGIIVLALKSVPNFSISVFKLKQLNTELHAGLIESLQIFKGNESLPQIQFL